MFSGHLPQGVSLEGVCDLVVWGLLLVTFAPRGRGVKPPMHFHYVLHA